MGALLKEAASNAKDEQQLVKIKSIYPTTALLVSSLVSPVRELSDGLRTKIKRLCDMPCETCEGKNQLRIDGAVIHE